MRALFSFPNPVNETSARLVAGSVAVLSVLTIAFQQGWAIPVLAYGFLARVLTGPKLSPLGLLATRVVTPRLPVRHRYSPGPAKRFPRQEAVREMSVASAGRPNRERERRKTARRRSGSYGAQAVFRAFRSQQEPRRAQ